MPGLAHRNDQCCNAMSSSPAASANSFWSKNRGDVCYNQLQKFWSDLSPRAREELLRIDKQMLFEQARKNMYCSRCNGLLLEGFLQIVMYGKSFHQEGAAGQLSSAKSSASRITDDSGLSIASSCQEEIQDPSVHPWGGLTTTRDGSLTLLDCYLYSKSLRGLQIVFDSARARERERELLYPDACGGGGRGWISQGVAAYGRGHGIRESCALHTARLSCDTLVDFWSALGDETRLSLLRMKEEDFIERLVYRFDSKRFCRDCRRNVIREFKELKELKRMRREPRCTSCFCVADTAFQYEVSDDTIQADWHQTFADSIGLYRHFEWAVGTGEGKSDILEFENIGLNGSVQVTGLDLADLNACFITLRAWKFDGRCTELSVKAHALKGQRCVHSRLVVGDGFVSITRGESIRSFFEHAEEAEEEEDDDSTDKDGNDLDGECSRPQKHAKSPELAREFLLDAAIVIFKEQVEKAFREGTARQNAHSIFVCLSLKLLEERVHIACKEIITLEKQMKLLEEEEKEKREEEERKERRRTKEREKKLRRKERLKGKEKDREKKDSELDVRASCDASKEESSLNANKEPSEAVSYVASTNESADIINPMAISSDTEEVLTTGYSPLQTEDVCCGSLEADSSNVKGENESFTTEQSKFLHRRINSRKERQPESCFKWSDRQRHVAVSEGGMLCNKTDSRYPSDNFVTRSRGVYGAHRQVRTNMTKTNFHSSGSKCGEKFHSSNNRMNDRYDTHSCSCNQLNEYRERIDSHVSNRAVRDSKFVVKSELVLDMSKHSYRGNRYCQADNIRQGSTRTKSKVILANNSRSNVLYPKKVWEPTELQKKYSRSSSDSDVTLMSSGFKVEADTSDSTKSSGENCSSEDSVDSSEVIPKNSSLKESKDSISGMDVCQNGHKDPGHLTEAGDQDADLCLVRNNSFNRISDTRIISTSNSDNCSSCLSEVDSNASSSNHGNPESSSTSDSEDAPQQLERTKTPSCNGTSGFHEAEMEEKDTTSRMSLGGRTCIPVDGNGSISGMPLVKGSQPSSNINGNPLTGSKHHPDVFQMHHQNLYCQLFQGPSVMGYYPQNFVPWSPVPPNGLMQFPHPNNYLYAGPFGYGIDGNSGMCMQYETMQHLTPPLFNAGPLPVYQPSAKANGVYHEEKTQIPKQSSPPKTLNGVNGEKCVPSVTKHIDVPQDGEDGQRNSSAKMGAETTGFSLFHFGGPVALSNIKSNKPSEEAAIKDIASKVATDAVQVNHILNKKETVEEYNLFAGSNRTRFQFF